MSPVGYFTVRLDNGDLFATNTGNRLVEFLIVKRTVVESDQNVEMQLSSFNSLRSKISRRTASTAAVSSSLGIDKAFNGASPHFPINRLQCILPSSFVKGM